MSECFDSISSSSAESSNVGSMLFSQPIDRMPDNFENFQEIKNTQSDNGGQARVEEEIQRIGEIGKLNEYCTRWYQQLLRKESGDKDPRGLTKVFNDRVQAVLGIAQMGLFQYICDVADKVRLLLENEGKKRPLNYEGNFAYLTQVLRKFPKGYISPKGAAFVSFSEDMQPMIIPIGEDGGIAETITVANAIAATTGMEILLKKITPEQRDMLLSRQEGFQNYKYPFDEDVYAQAIVDLEGLTPDNIVGQGWRNPRRKMNNLRDNLDKEGEKIGFEELNLQTAVLYQNQINKLIEDWAKGKQERDVSRHGEVEWNFYDLTEPYRVYLDHKFLRNMERNKDIGLIMYKGKPGQAQQERQVIGLSIAGKTSENCSALYANPCHPLFPGAAHGLIIETMRLAQAKFKSLYVNMGGSETPTLYAFKRDFNHLPNDGELKEPVMHCMHFSLDSQKEQKKVPSSSIE